MNNTAARWNRIYESKTDFPEPSLVLRTFSHLLPASGRGLDVACGLGANSLLMARKGLEVDAFDISEVALSQLALRVKEEQLQVNTETVDLQQVVLPDNKYDVIIVSRYLDRALLPTLPRALKSGGILMYQTFTQTKVQASSGPSNPDYLLAPGELLAAFESLSLLAYRDEALFGDLDDGWRNECYLVAARP